MKKRYTCMSRIAAALSAVIIAVSITGCGEGDGSGTTDFTSIVETKPVDDKQGAAGSSDEASSGSESTDTESAGTESADQASAGGSVIAVSYPSEYRNHWNEEKQDNDVSTRVDGIHIMSEGYEKLQKTLDAQNMKLWDESGKMYDDSVAEIKEFTDDDRNFTYEYDNTVSLKRADSSVFSYERTDYSYLGGAHPSTQYNGYAYDTSSGRQLCLDDVTDDKDKIYEEVMKQLKASEDSSAFFEGWQDTIKKWFDDSDKNADTVSDTEDGTEDTHLDWYLDQTGLNVIINAYDIGPYAMGSRTISVSYDSGLVKKEYCADIADIAQDVTLYDSLTYTDADGNKKSAYLSAGDTSEDEENQNASLYIAKSEDDSSPVKIELSGYTINKMFLMTAPDSRKYLYVDSTSDNDYHTLDVIDMDSDKHEIIGNCDDGAIYDHDILDCDSFILGTRLELLGTYSAYRTYHVGNDGMPVKNEEEYTIENYDADWADQYSDGESAYSIPELKDLPYSSALKTKCDIDVMMHPDETDEKKQETLPAGTVCIPYKTDGKTYMTFKSVEGKLFDVEVKADDYEYSVDGMNQDDVFDGMIYAG